MSLIFRNFPKKILFSNIVKRTTHHKENLNPEDKKFTAIYRLPHIQVCAAVSKVKLPYLCGIGVVVPSSFVGYALHVCTLDVPIIFSTVGFASTAALFAVGQVFNRLVGFVYLSEDKEHVKISYLDLWGNRNEGIHNVQDIRHLDNPSWPMHLFYKHLNISSITKPYKISPQFGEALEISTCNKIFNYDFDGD